jgi:hypothetical protein
MRVTRDQWDAWTVEIAGLMDLASSENEVIRRLEVSGAGIRQVHAAKVVLRPFRLSDLGEALDFARERVGAL